VEAAMPVSDPFFSLQPMVFVPVIRDALARIKEIQMAFVYGSSVRGDTRADSDIDVMILGNEEPSLADMGEALFDLEVPLGRPVDLWYHSPNDFLQRLETGNRFITRVMLEPKIWVIGFESQLDALVNHARILSKAESALGSRVDAVAWIATKNWALGGSRPVELMASDAGVRRVERVLRRIEPRNSI
jgi:predicted nucleotidyltransferase